MMTREEAFAYSRELVNRLSVLLNGNADFIKPEMIAELTTDFNIASGEAFSLLFAAALGLDIHGNAHDRRLYELFFPHMIHCLDESFYAADSYYKNIQIPECKSGDWEFKLQKLMPYEAFVCGDFLALQDGRVIPQIGYFDCEFSFPAVLQNGREWMTVTPNEIETHHAPLRDAFGNVLTCGLGLGYFTYMASEKENVSRITVVESDERLIGLFKNNILPLFPHKDKVEIVCADAFDFAKRKMPAGNYDYAYFDIWHDPSDGVEAYKRLKQFECLCPDTKFGYWLSETMKYYMHGANG